MKTLFNFLILSQFGGAAEWFKVCILIMLNLTDYRLYVITYINHISAFLNKKKMWSSEIMDELPSGYLIGADFIGWTNYVDSIGKGELRIITSKHKRKLIDSMIDVPVPRQQEVVKFETLTSIKTNRIWLMKLDDLSSSGLYVHTFLSEFKPTQDQLRVVNEILRIYDDKKRTCVYIHGPAGTGKTTVAYLVAQHIEAMLSCSFLPTTSRPGILNHYRYSIVERDAECLVLRIDEADLMFEAITKGVSEEEAKGSVMVRSKADWNNFLDDFGIGMYKRTMLIMTSNRPPEYINSLDPSYMRKGRVNAVFEMNQVVEFDA